MKDLFSLIRKRNSQDFISIINNSDISRDVIIAMIKANADELCYVFEALDIAVECIEQEMKACPLPWLGGTEALEKIKTLSEKIG